MFGCRLKISVHSLKIAGLKIIARICVYARMRVCIWARWMAQGLKAGATGCRSLEEHKHRHGTQAQEQERTRTQRTRIAKEIKKTIANKFFLTFFRCIFAP